MPGTASIAVLMSTYNGACYIKEQIDSILSQVGVNVSLYVRDDCSTDETKSILQYYSSRYDNVHVINGGRRLGPANSFMETLYFASTNSDASYFALSDQDDIWRPEKLAIAISRISEYDRLELYCSNQTLYSDGIELGLRYATLPNLTIQTVLFSNQVSGCTMVFTQALARKLSDSCARPDSCVLDMRMHDTWIMLAALALGKVVYDPESHIDYRVHSGNVVGTKNDKVTLLRRFVLAFNAARHGQDVGYRSAYAAELIKRFPDGYKNGWEKVEELANYKKSFRDRVKLLADREMRASSGELGIEYAAKVLLGTF